MPSAEVQQKAEAAQAWNAVTNDVLRRIAEESRRQAQGQLPPPPAQSDPDTPEAEALLKDERADRELAAEGNIVAACCVFASLL